MIAVRGERWDSGLRHSNDGIKRVGQMNEFFGFDRLREEVNVSYRFIPSFKTEILEETDRYLIVRRDTGVIAKEFKGELSYHMPQWLKFPLETRKDWENEIKPRLNPDSPER